MGNPMGHEASLDIESFSRLPIDYLLIQNYDRRADYLSMLRKSLEWKQ